MERFVKGDVVVLPFPYTDFSSVKKRPAIVIATLRGNNVILAQITGQPRPDPDLLELSSKDFQSGGISRDSFVRPFVLFTIHKSKINYKAGIIKP